MPFSIFLMLFFHIIGFLTVSDFRPILGKMCIFGIMKRILFFSFSFFLLSLLIVSCTKKGSEKVSTVSFRTISMKEEHHLNDNVKNPILSIELKFQFPTAYADDSVLKKIRKILLADFLPDVPDTSIQPEFAMKSFINGKIKLYESSADIVKDEDTQEPGSQPAVAWKDNTNLLIRCNENGLLSYTIESTQFSGGAHGGITFRNALIDLKTGEKIGEEDLFTEASLPLINEIVLKKLETQNKVETPEELEQIGYFDVTQIGQYKNFYLTKEGIVYLFNEGEIGAYALGTIEVKLSFQDLEGFIAPDGPLEKFIQ